jgi:hypothetical protein
MSNKYLVTNTTQLNVTTTAGSMYDYLKLFGLGEKIAQEIHVKFGNDVKKLLEIELDDLTMPRMAKVIMRKAKEALQQGMDAGETADEVLEELQKGQHAGETLTEVIAKRQVARDRYRSATSKVRDWNVV